MKRPPGKGTGVLSHTPGETLTGLVEDKFGDAKAQACGHEATLIEHRRVNAFKLARLGMCEGLSKSEREFLAGISHQTRLSPEQEAVVARLSKQYLGKRPSK